MRRGGVAEAVVAAHGVNDLSITPRTTMLDVLCWVGCGVLVYRRARNSNIEPGGHV